MADTPEYRRITVYAKKDPKSGAYPYRDYERDFRSYINNALKSALPKDAFYYVSDKQISSTGRAKFDVYVHSDNAGVVSKAFAKESALHTYKGSVDEKYHSTKAIKLTEDEIKLVSGIESAKNQKEEETETTRFNKGMLVKILGSLFAITDVAKRILSAVIANAKQTVSDAVTGHNVGISTEAVRQYRYIESAHGLAEGTFTGALSTVQNWFGNITKLDESALEDLAVVMGGEIQKMATMGLGASDPEQIVGAIIDAFNRQASAGVTSTGKYVGEAEARRELYSYLLRLSPELADIFAKMQEEQDNINSIYRNFKDYADWKTLLDTNRGDWNKSFINVEVSTGELANKVDSIFEQIKQGLMLNLNPMVMTLLRRISNIRWGLSASENAEMNKANNESNKAYLSFLNNTLAGMQGDLTPERAGLKATLEKEKKKVEKEIELYGKGKDVMNLTKGIDELRVEGAGNTQAILAFSSVKNKFTDEESKALIKRAIDERIPESTKQEIKAKLEEGEEDNLRKKKLAEKKKLYNSLVSEYKSKGMTYGEINEKIAEEHPELLQIQKVKKKKWGKEYEDTELVWMYKYLTGEEEQAIKQEANEGITEDILYNYLFKKFKSKLDIGAYQVQEAMERMSNVPEASIMALYAQGDWEDKIKKLPEADVYDYNLIGVNEKKANGEVVHKIILDVNANGKIDKKDLVLGEFMGYEGYSGTIGKAHAEVDGKNVAWNIDPYADGASTY